MPTPRFIYFDLGNVLVHFSHRRAARQMAEVAQIPEETAWQIVFESDLEERYERGDVSSAEFYEEFCTKSGSRPDQQALLRAGADIFELNVPVVPIVAGLRTARCPLGILSNTNESHWNWVYAQRFMILKSGFETHVLSYEVGSLKPDGRIYQVAAERAGVACSEILFTDDRPENVAGAQAAGMDAVQFTSAGQLAADLRQRGVRFNY